MKPARRQPSPPRPSLSVGDRAGSPNSILLLLMLMVMVAAAVVAVYWPVLHAQAVSFDDEETIIQNPLVQNPSWNSVGRFFSEVRLSSVVPGYYRPLTLTSLMLDWAMGARTKEFRPFHRTSLALHVGSTLLLVVLCYQFFPLTRRLPAWREGPRNAASPPVADAACQGFGRPTIAATVGLLFGLHPLTIEPVAWVMERKTLLAAFFAFACLCAYVRYAHCGRWRWFVFAVLLYLLSLLSKPTGTPLPIMMLLLDHWPLRRLSRRAVLEKIPFFALAAVFAVLAVVCEKLVNPLYIPAKLSPLHLPLRVCWLIVFYLYKIALPVHLSSAYQPPRPLSLANPIIPLAVLGTALLIAGLIVSRRRTPAIWVGTAIFFLGLAPTMGFVGYSWVVASDKYVYLPAVGLVVMLAYLLGRLVYDGAGRLRPRTAAITAVCIIAALSAEGVRTRTELFYWRDTESLCRHMLEATPDAAALHIGISLPLTEQGRENEAFAHLARALELAPRDPVAHNNYGSALAARGNIRGAVRHYLIALHYKPHHKGTLNNLAWDLSVHDFDRPLTDHDPIALAREACQLTGYRWPMFLDTLAAAYANAGRFPEAVDTARDAVRLAQRADNQRLARDIQGRLQLYLAGRPYREVVQTRPASNPVPGDNRRPTDTMEDRSR